LKCIKIVHTSVTLAFFSGSLFVTSSFDFGDSFAEDSFLPETQIKKR